MWRTKMNKMPGMKHDVDSTRLALALLALFAPLAAHAAGQAGTDAGALLRQIQPAAVPAPTQPGPRVSIQQEGRANLPASLPFLIKSVRISGNTLFASAALHGLVADAEGKSLTLPELDVLVSHITDYYHARGYTLSRAFIPAQIIRDGAVSVVILEARYGNNSLVNRSKVNDSLLKATLSPLQSGQFVEQEKMDRTMLLLSDIPGIVASATLKPGASVGTSDFVVDAAPAPAMSANFALDNYGNRYTGRTRAGGIVNVTNPLHRGDILSVSALSSGGGMDNARLAYALLASGQGTRVGGAYFALRYELGAPLADLNAHGEARGENLWMKHPFLRSRDANLYGQIQYEQVRLRDHVDTTAIQNDRRSRNWTVNLSGDARDELLSGGVNSWDAGWTGGRLAIDDETARASDAATAQTQGRFSKWYANLARVQRVGQSTTLQLAFSGQRAGANLDSSQKLTVGGPYTLRAYDLGALSGDSATITSVEIRRDLDLAGGQWQALAFIDHARVTVNRTAWTAGENRARLSGAGIGANWAGSGWSAKASVAKPIGARPALVASRDSIRAWLEIGKQF
jgi:hemolysin activation/secretion protein